MQLNLKILSQFNNIWKTRDWLSFAQKKDGPSIKHDISIPISNIPTFIKTAEVLIKKVLPNSKILIFGHIADANIHYNISSKDIENKKILNYIQKKLIQLFLI